MARNHDFNFDGGEYLTSMGATWFVSYSFFYFPTMNLKFLGILIDKKGDNNE